MLVTQTDGGQGSRAPGHGASGLPCSAGAQAEGS
jgi:hypothetical protein